MNRRNNKKSKKTKSQIDAEIEHQKFLKKMGISSRSSVGSEQRSSKPWVTGSSPVESAIPPCSDVIPVGLPFKRKRTKNDEN